MTSQETRKFNVDSDDFPSPILGKDMKSPGNLYKTILFDKRVRNLPPSAILNRHPRSSTTKDIDIADVCHFFRAVAANQYLSSVNFTMPFSFVLQFNSSSQCNCVRLDFPRLLSSKHLVYSFSIYRPDKVIFSADSISYLQFSYVNGSSVYIGMDSSKQQSNKTGFLLR